MATARLSASERRKQILDVAIDVFGNAGYFGASMNEIAEAAGVTKPVLYQHFDSKSDLYRALIKQVGHRLIGEIAAATADAADGKEQTERGFQAYFRWVSQRHDEFMLLFGGSARHEAEFSAQIRSITEDAAAAIAPLIAVDVPESDRHTLAHGLVGLAEGASRRLVSLGEPFDADQVARQISALAWAGLRSVSKPATA